jgi:hypothetical protein
MRQTPIAILLFIILFATTAQAADPGPADVVKAFNTAITERKLDVALAYFAKGSVQYTLRAAHAGVPTGDAGITSDLKAHWSTIGPVVISSTSAYRRVPEILDARIDGDLATVWAKTSSESVDRNGKAQKNKFSEVYLLVKTAAGWQIGAMADNRGTTAFAGAPTEPAGSK